MEFKQAIQYKTWLWYFNFYLLQWFFIRLVRVTDVNTKKIKGFNVIGFILPMTGWTGWRSPYAYLVKFEFRLITLVENL